MRGAWIFAGLALLATGCNEKPPEDWVSYDVPPAATPPGWSRYENADAGFTIDLPASWMVETGKPEETKALTTAAVKAFPKADAHSISRDALDFDLKFTDLEPGNLKAGVLQSGSVKVEATKSDYKSKGVTASAELPTMKDKMTVVSSGVTTVGPYTSLKYKQLLPNHAGGAELPGQTLLIYFGREQTYWVLTFTYADVNASTTEPIIEKIRESIRFKKPDLDAVRATRDKRKREAESTLGLGG